MLTCCSKCGTPYERDSGYSTCPECRPRQSVRTERAKRGTARQRGYDYTWEKLSIRARQLQPFCSECSSPLDLTVDHTPQAWARKAAGKVIRLQDIVVLCRSCNSSAGAARGDRAREDEPDEMPPPF